MKLLFLVSTLVISFSSLALSLKDLKPKNMDHSLQQADSVQSQKFYEQTRRDGTPSNIRIDKNDSTMNSTNRQTEKEAMIIR